MRTTRPFRNGLGFLLLATVLLAAACAPRPVGRTIADLQQLPQDPTVYLNPATADRSLLPTDEQQQRTDHFLQQFFAPWQASAPLETTRKPFWAVDWLRSAAVYGMNLQQVAESFSEELIARADLEGYPSLDRKAISLRRCNLRALPTRQPLFNDPARPGEGFPFDGLQHSALPANTPLHVTHRSADGAWVFVETTQVYGWLPVTELAWVDTDFMKRFATGHYRVVIFDRVPVVDVDGTFRFQVNIGNLLPAVSAENPEVLIAIADAQRQAQLVTAQLPVGQSAAFPLVPTQRQIAALAAPMLGQPYDWGGQLGHRDCSATLQDLFASFGIWLPRNSSKQALQGRVIPLLDLAPAQREQRLLADGVPFQTLVAMP
ncbi:MAG: glycoside hydrolase, partial [Desulfuromonas sp.]